MREWLATPGGIAVLTLITALVSGGTVVGLIRVVPERRKIKAETVTEGANAAALLSGVALQMVENERASATVRVQEANENAARRIADSEQRAQDAEGRRVAAEQRAHDAEASHRVCEEESMAYAREIGRLVRRLARWEDWATEGKEPPREVPHEGDPHG